jgi:hypothetical protein
MSDEFDDHPSVIIAISTALSNSKEYWKLETSQKESP